MKILVFFIKNSWKMTNVGKEKTENARTKEKRRKRGETGKGENESQKRWASEEQNKGGREADDVSSEFWSDVI